VRAWLIDHDDQRYPGRTKQLKAYTHCLEHGAAEYEWVTFIDCDEFIALEKHRDLKAFLAEFEGYDSIALNWHVFGHNGYYEDPAGLVIESLTRRMKEPRPMPKSLSRTAAIAAVENPHVCQLKPGRKCVDANKRPYREELYPGKTRIARINHYQCRSFTDWMRKLERGEAGTFAVHPVNTWRFSQEGRLRQFVSQIALNKNEHIDRSMLRHAEPVKRYLSRLRNTSEIEQRPRDDEECSTSKISNPSRAATHVIRTLVRNLNRALRIFW
jgi:glycosyl transferase family 92